MQLTFRILGKLLKRVVGIQVVEISEERKSCAVKCPVSTAKSLVALSEIVFLFSNLYLLQTLTIRLILKTHER